MGMKKLSDMKTANQAYIDSKASKAGDTFTGAVTFNAKVITNAGLVAPIGTDKYAT